LRRVGAAGLALGGALCAASAANAAPPGPRDPNWPCQQIKVPELSLAAIWSGPPLDTQQVDWRQNAQVADLVHDLAQRRMPIDQAQNKIRAVAQHASEQKQSTLLELLAGLFGVFDEERSAVIAGLERFGARQKQLAAAIRDNNEKLRAMQSDPKTDAGDLNMMVQRITWDTEVFRDRQQALSYACEVPGKIEQRLFTLARTIQQESQ
jgi:hypothetical protein